MFLCMSHMILVQAEIDETIKASAERWLKGQGIVPDEAIRIFYREVVACHGLPFGMDNPKSLHGVDSLKDTASYEEISAVSIPSVTVELREAYSQGCEMLELLTKFKEDRAISRAARRAQKQGVTA